MVLVSKGTYFKIGIFKFSTALKICKTQTIPRIILPNNPTFKCLQPYILTAEKYSMGFICTREEDQSQKNPASHTFNQVIKKRSV